MSETSDGSSADYYVLPEGAEQLQDLISYRNMNGQLAEIFRACYRYGLASHSAKMRDAKKMLFYAQAEVKRLEMYESEPAPKPYDVIRTGPRTWSLMDGQRALSQEEIEALRIKQYANYHQNALPVEENVK